MEDSTHIRRRIRMRMRRRRGEEFEEKPGGIFWTKQPLWLLAT